MFLFCFVLNLKGKEKKGQNLYSNDWSSDSHTDKNNFNKII